MRIVEIREAAASVGGGLRNAAVDFSTMTVSAAAVIADAGRAGGPVVGIGFSAPGRYAQGGILRERLIPRILAAAPENLIDSAGLIDPEAVWRAAMTNEKPGGHGDRAVALAALDVAVWDLLGKLVGRPLWSVFAERANGGAADEAVHVYPGGGYYRADGDLGALRAEMQGYLDRGLSHREDEGGRRRAGGGSPSHRGGDRRCGRGRACRGGRQRSLRPWPRAALRRGVGPLRPDVVRGTGRSARLCVARGARGGVCTAARRPANA